MATNNSIGTASVSLALGKEREQWVTRAWDAIDESKLAELNRMMASIASPTGEEKQVALALVDSMNATGVAAHYQPMGDDQGNAVGRIAGTGNGADLLLYAPLDTAFSTNEEEECPWIGDRLPEEMTTNAYIRDGEVVGMGAENPKGYAACTIAAAQAIKAVGVPLQGSLLVGLGSGGMPGLPVVVPPVIPGPPVVPPVIPGFPVVPVVPVDPVSPGFPVLPGFPGPPGPDEPFGSPMAPVHPAAATRSVVTTDRIV